MTSHPGRDQLRSPRILDLDTLDPTCTSRAAIDGHPDDGQPGGDDPDGSNRSATNNDANPKATAPAGPLLYTPADAAALLAVSESWLRRRAAARAIACTFLGKHLRFSPADLHAIITSGTQHPTTRPTSARRRTGHRAPAAPTPDRRPGTRADHAVSPGELSHRPLSTRRRATGALGREEGVASWRG